MKKQKYVSPEVELLFWEKDDVVCSSTDFMGEKDVWGCDIGEWD